MNKSVCLRTLAAAALSAAFLLNASAAGAATILVRAGDNLQAVINAAQPGDTLLLEAGATFTGNFVLPVKSGSAFITIKSNAPDSAVPGPGVRVSPAHAALLPKLRSPNTAPALVTAPGTHHWRLVLLEFIANKQGYGEILQIGDGSLAQNNLSMVPYQIELDRLYIHGDPAFGQKRGVALNAAAVTIRNCHISDIKAVGIDTQAIGGWNGPGPFTIENNYLEASGENFLLGGADPGIANLVSTDVVVRHNYFSRPLSWRDPVVPTPTGVVASENGAGTLPAGDYSYRVVARRLVSGGITARSTASTTVTARVSGSAAAVTISWAAVPDTTEYYVYGRSAGALNQYWVVTGTTFTDTGAAGRSGAVPTSIGDRWLVKNLLELKNARNVLIEYNIFENNWLHGQSGYAILFTPRNQDGTCSWCVVEQVTFQYNIVRNVAAGINILGHDNINPAQRTKNITIKQNLFHRMGGAMEGTGWFVLISDGPENVVIDRNTIDATSNAVLYIWAGASSPHSQVPGFVFTNNASRHQDYGINGAVYSYGNGIITNYFPGGVVRGNWLQGGAASRYPAGNYFDGTFNAAFVDAAAGNYAPAAGGVLVGQATDGGNIGVDMAALHEGTKAVLEGNGAARPRPPTNLRIIK